MYKEYLRSKINQNKRAYKWGTKCHTFSIIPKSLYCGFRLTSQSTVNWFWDDRAGMACDTSFRSSQSAPLICRYTLYLRVVSLNYIVALTWTYHLQKWKSNKEDCYQRLAPHRRCCEIRWEWTILHCWPPEGADQSQGSPGWYKNWLTQGVAWNQILGRPDW